VMPSYQGLLSAGEVGALVEYIRYLSTQTAEARLSPLAPRGSPVISLPEVAGQPLGEDFVPPPFGGGPEPRGDGPPYSPPGMEPNHPNSKGP
jgi:hypothetical protein